MFHVDREIRVQAGLWRRAADLAAVSRHQLPTHGQRIAVVGCGSSWFMAMAYASLREARGLGVSDAQTASEFAARRSYDHVIGISRSGSTTETVELLAALRGRVRTTAITTVPDSPITQVADETIVLDFAAEQAVMATGSMTATLALFRAHLGDDVHRAAADVPAALDADLGDLADCEQIAFIGSGWTVGLANEAALKMREAAQYWAEAHPAMDYRHGPFSIAQPGRAVWCFGPPPRGLAEEVTQAGARFVSNTIDPMAHLVMAQRLAVQIAKHRGLNPDQPRNLARSVILG